MLSIEQYEEVRRFRMGRSLFGRSYYTAAYQVGDLLIDSGCAHTVHELVAAVAGRPPRRIVNTHSHEDHFAANAALRRRFGAAAAAHRLALPVLERPARVRRQIYRHLMWGVPRGAPAAEVPAVVETDEHRFEVVAAPGHSADSICLFERDRGWLFVGDAFVGGRDRVLKHDSEVWEIIASLERLRALGPTMLFTGSGSVYVQPDEVLALKIEYLRETGARILAMHERGLPEAVIRDLVLGGEQLIGHVTQGDFSALALVRSYLRRPV